MKTKSKIKINKNTNNNNNTNTNTNSLDTFENLDQVLDFPTYHNNQINKNILSPLSPNRLQNFNNTYNNNNINIKTQILKDRIKKKVSKFEKTEKELEKNHGAAKHGKVFTKFDDKAFLSKIKINDNK